KLAMAVLDAIHTDIFRKLDGGTQTPERWNIRASDSLEAFGTDCFVIPAFGGDGVPELVDDFVADVEKSRAFRCLEPLVWTGGIHVASKVVDVEPHHAWDMRTIYGGENAFATGECAEFLRRENYAGIGRDVAEEKDAGSRRDGIVEKIEDLCWILNRLRQ